MNTTAAFVFGRRKQLRISVERKGWVSGFRRESTFSGYTGKYRNTLIPPCRNRKKSYTSRIPAIPEAAPRL